ncbi:Non-motile and phage-resistance protein [uncultured Clostridium sp.]|nr:Non-motile and phage-resistance protein [uncultured Clostridium sp.]SCJ11037.1 Non-motile and phage-resistance protein [uncultured Clostridium sp.]
MVDKLIYIMNLSLLIASIFCLTSHKNKKNISINLIIVLIFFLNFFNFKMLSYIYIISAFISLNCILIINDYDLRKDKNTKLITLILIVVSTIILKDKLKYLSLINILLNAYILLKIFYKRIYETTVKDKHVYKDLQILKDKASSNINVLKDNEDVTKEIYNTLNNKKEILNIILEQNNKCVIVIDKHGYISNEDNSFSSTWKEYEFCNYKIKFSYFLSKSIENSTEVLLDVQKVYDIGIEMNREVISKDNRYFDCKYAPLKVNNETMGVVCIMTDITYKKYSQKMLDFNKIKYKKTIETIPHTIVVTKGEEIIYNNNKNLDIDVYDKDLKKFIIDTKVKGSFKGNENNIGKKYLNISKTSFKENNITKQIAILRDVTEYKTLLDNIENSSKKYISLVDSIPQGIYIYDFESKKTIYANNVLLNMSGFENVEEFNKSNIIKDISWILNKFGQDVKFIRHKIQNRNGESIDVELGGITLEINNKMKCIGIMNDITEKVKAENIEREITKKRLEYKQKNHFFINMSHELKTPLNLIMSSNQLMESIFKDEIFKNPKGKIAKATKIVKKQGYISLRLIENIITLAKLESDFYKPKLDYYDIVSIVEDIIIEVNKYSKNDGIEFIFDTDIEEKVIKIDPYDIERVILLLFSKIVKQSKSKSVIYVEFSHKNDNINISIKNKGDYDKYSYLNNQSKENINMNIEVAKSIMKIYDGNIDIFEYEKDIEIAINLSSGNKINYENKKESNLNKEAIYAEYSMMNAL